VNEVDPVNVHISLPGLLTTGSTIFVCRRIFYKDDKISVVLLGTGMINKPMNEWRTCGTGIFLALQKSHDFFVREGAPLSRAFVFGTRFRRFTNYKTHS
jgi:hypothetical protein